jgi:hypothetical protein
MLLSLTLFSCVKERGSEEAKQFGSITLIISCADMTRATEEGSDTFNENLLNTLDIFYYRDSTDEDCFEHDRISGTYYGSASYTKNLEILTKEKFFGTGDTGSCYVYVIANGPQTKIDTLLDNNTASVDSLKKIVLFSPDLSNSEVKTEMGDLLVKQTNFTMDGGATMSYSNGSASVDVKLARSLSKIQLYVHLADTVYVNGKAYMPSIISVNSTSKKAWGKAVFSNGLMRGYINDSDTTNAYSPSDGDFYPASGLSYDQKARYIRQDTLAISRDSTTYYSHSPFYTYPMTWETFSANLSTRPTTLMLVVDWYTKESGGMTAKTTFYSIDVNMKKDAGEEYKFKRNTFYKMYVDVNALGSDSSTDPVEITGVCEILDWNHVNQETSIENLRFLTVEQNEYVLDNENTLYIPYATSHDCEIVNVSVWAYNIKTNTVAVDSLVKTTSALTAPSSEDSSLYIPDGYNQLGKYVVDTILSTEHLRPYSFKLTDNQIIVQHKLDNRADVNDDIFDYMPFHITFTVRHSDNAAYSETISITQHPEISVEPQKNSDSDYGNYNDSTGYVYVNGYNPVLGEGSAIGNGLPWYLTMWAQYKSNQSTYGGAHGLSYDDPSSTPYIIQNVKLSDVEGISDDALNRNPYRYMIRTAVANGDTQYIIGDPRTYKPDSLLYNNGEWSKYAIGMDSEGNISTTTTRRLQNYYRSRRHGEMPNAQNVLSPRFIVASSYGVTRSVTRINAERRCASYQEEGYPAGRWRVPTTAEVMFCVQLTRNGMIPRLFGMEESSSYSDDSYFYFTSTGYIEQGWNDDGTEYVNPTEGSDSDPVGNDYTTHTWVRCVYDAWYWGQEPVLSKNSSFSAGGTTVTGYRFTWGDIAR